MNRAMIKDTSVYNLTDRQLRLRCLELAIERKNVGNISSTTVELANAFYEFVSHGEVL